MVKAARASMPPRRRFFFFFAKTSSASSVTKRTTGFSIVGVGALSGARQQEFYFGKKKTTLSAVTFRRWRPRPTHAARKKKMELG